MNSILEKLERGNYRSATEDIVEKMKSLAEEHGDVETVAELEGILGKLFDLPNIDWKKAEEQDHWTVSKFVQ